LAFIHPLWSSSWVFQSPFIRDDEHTIHNTTKFVTTYSKLNP
jgi:hypothetical protein